MQAGMKNPALVLDVNEPVQQLLAATHAAGVKQATLELVHLRASQTNGCRWCVDSGARSAARPAKATSG